MQKPTTAMRKKGGPQTAKGKLISSHNALKTGATTKQLLNEQEHARFHQLKTDLTNHYHGTNPLIALQIEKIARLHIQLERIQNAIDALYRQSEIHLPRTKSKPSAETDSLVLKLQLRMMLGLVDKSLIANIKNTLLMGKIKKVFGDPKQVKTTDDTERPIVNQESLLGAYLYAEASHYQQDVSDYLHEKVKVINRARDAKDLYQHLNIEVLSNAIDLMQKPDLQESIVMDSYYEFRQFNDWFETELSKLSDQLAELEAYFKEKENNAYVPMPNFDELDRLMRYQTTISRQLSTAVGELMILAKQSIAHD